MASIRPYGGVWEALRKDAARAGRLSADEFPHQQLDADGESTPWEVGQMTLVAAMHRG
jgi:hypothetical protein